MTRKAVTEVFCRTVFPHLSSNRNLTVAVVGAGSMEPELLALKGLWSVQMAYFGIASSEAIEIQHLDLNVPGKSNAYPHFDLVLCSQVLEHVFDVPAAFSNLCELAKPGGLIWIGVPMSNFVHGSPEYYSAGYAPELMQKLAEREGQEVVAVGYLGSRREYLSRHLTGIWFTDKQIQHPIFSYFGCEGNLLVKFLHNIKLVPARIFLAATSNHQKMNRLDATESWALIRTKI